MIEREYRRRYWQSTARNGLVSLGVLAGIVLSASLFAGLFDGWRFLGFPLSFYLAAQGAFLLMIALFSWSSSRQDEIDRQHGAAEDL